MIRDQVPGRLELRPQQLVHLNSYLEKDPERPPIPRRRGADVPWSPERARVDGDSARILWLCECALTADRAISFRHGDDPADRERQIEAETGKTVAVQAADESLDGPCERPTGGMGNGGLAPRSPMYQFVFPAVVERHLAI